ncbi:NUDIX domain-containing protein [Streptomyces sanglieri]|uniref:NUDIX domain-containing protein n=1 Tax=Streptomyces sanglieri TaxID=193460 RepID=A0ABW2WPH1_9ACTN
MSRRAGDVYAAGLWHCPSGHYDGPHEDVVAALIREAAEETGVSIKPAAVRFAVLVHHRAPGGGVRVGMFFEVRAWQGVPRVREPAVCDAMCWFPLDVLPASMVAYCRAGLDAYRSGQLMAVHFQDPGDPIPYFPGIDRMATSTGHCRQIGPPPFTAPPKFRNGTVPPFHERGAICGIHPGRLVRALQRGPWLSRTRGRGEEFARRARAGARGGRALDACSGTGEMAAYLASLGYGVDFAEGALERARSEHAGVEGVRWLCLDVEHDDLADLSEDGYDLITLRLCIAFVRDRARVLRRLAALLREEGVLVVITPITENTSSERRHIALDEDELVALTDGFENVERFDAAGLAVLVLRGTGGSFSAQEKLRPAPQAVLGAAVVVTDAYGRVLLGRSTRGMWELPGGRIETGEAAPAAAVRELTEETGLTARPQDAHVVTVLHDDRLDVRRVTAVVRLTGWGGELGLPEPHRFMRWEWHDLPTLTTLGKIFAPSAQALNAVWPGILPGLPPVHSYVCATTVPPVPGEPAEAVRLRGRMADIVIGNDWAPSPRVQAALREVPRHRFVPEAALETAYHDDLAVVTVRDSPRTALSSVSAAWLQAHMIEELRLEPGTTVLEVGSGGYNAELLAHVVGDRGRVVTVDVDPHVVHRTQRLCAEAGSGRVTAVVGDGGLGAPGHVPARGFDGLVITHSTADIAPSWREQLAEGARLVVPLEMGATPARSLWSGVETCCTRSTGRTADSCGTVVPPPAPLRPSLWPAARSPCGGRTGRPATPPGSMRRCAGPVTSSPPASWSGVPSISRPCRSTPRPHCRGSAA